MADEELSKLVIVTQTPPHLRKHPGGDRTGNFQTRAKMSTELAEVINEGLLCYEQVSVGISPQQILVERSFSPHSYI